jgi:hypothetical protein
MSVPGPPSLGTSAGNQPPEHMAQTTALVAPGTFVKREHCWFCRPHPSPTGRPTTCSKIKRPPGRFFFGRGTKERMNCLFTVPG